MGKGDSHVAVTKVLDCGLKMSGFKLQLSYYVHFHANILGKGMNLLILPNDRLNSITAVLL